MRCLEQLYRDIRFALRTLGRRPLFTTVTVLTLGLGIGAATAVYTIADSVLLRKLPYPELDRLVTVWTTRPDWRGRETLDLRWDRVHMSYDEFRSWRDGTSTFDAVALYKSEEYLVGLSGSGEDERISVGVASSSLLSVLGIQSTVGRWFLPGEDGPGAERLAVIGHTLWQERFDSDPGVVGSTVTMRDDEDITGETYTVIGIAPRELRLRRTIDWHSPRGFNLWRTADIAEKDLWLPVGVDGQLGRNYEGIGRLRPGVSLEQAAAEIGPLIRGEEPPGRRGVRVMPRSGVLTAGLRSQLVLLTVPAVLLLLIAFSNMAALLLGEAEGRRRELLTRMAVGASRTRIAGQLLTESAVLGLLGSALGVYLAILGTDGLVAMAPPASPLRDVQTSWAALIFACAVGIGGALLFGSAPAVLSGNQSIGPALQTGGRASSPRGRGLQSRIVTLQVAFTAMMLVQAGLLTRTLVNLYQVDLGFDGRNLAVVRYLLPHSYDPEFAAYHDEILERVAAVAGVEKVGLIQSLPFTVRGGTWDDVVELEGRSLDQPHSVELRVVSPGYHEAMGIQLLSGRLLSRSDGPDNVKVALVSESMARALWPDRSAIGTSFRQMGRRYTVVGVVADVRHHGFVEDIVSIAYVSYAQRSTNSAYVVARLDGGAAAALPSIRAAIQSSSPHVVLHITTTMSELLSRRATDQRYHAFLATGFGIVSVLLAAAGVFGVAARAVARRSREIAVKKALGAREDVLLRDVVGSGIRKAVVGVSAGLIVALVGCRFLTAFFFGVSPADPMTYLAAGSFIILVCIVASLVPARRILALDPMEVLRAE